MNQENIIKVNDSMYYIFTTGRECPSSPPCFKLTTFNPTISTLESIKTNYPFYSEYIGLLNTGIETNSTNLPNDIKPMPLNEDLNNVLKDAQQRQLKWRKKQICHCCKSGYDAYSITSHFSCSTHLFNLKKMKTLLQTNVLSHLTNGETVLDNYDYNSIRCTADGIVADNNLIVFCIYEYDLNKYVTRAFDAQNSHTTYWNFLKNININEYEQYLDDYTYLNVDKHRNKRIGFAFGSSVDITEETKTKLTTTAFTSPEPFLKVMIVSRTTKKDSFSKECFKKLSN